MKLLFRMSLLTPPFGTSFPAAFPVPGDLDRDGSPDVVIANGTAVLVARDTVGHPPLLALISTDATLVGGALSNSSSQQSNYKLWTTL